MCFGERECCQPTYGYPSRGSLPIGAADNVARGSTGNFIHLQQVFSRVAKIALSHLASISAMALLRHADCVERCPLLGVTRKTFAHTEFFSV
jgi:hypothetical protein